MREKKVRGMKRKIKKVIERINEYTLEFPVKFYNDYWHLYLPVAKDFINSNKAPTKIRRLCMQTLVDRAKYLMEIKPYEEENHRVVVCIRPDNLWNSQLIVFKGDSYFKDFFCRNDEYQKWIRLSDYRGIQVEWELSLHSEMQVIGFKEIIMNEDDSYYEGVIWFIGELE